MHILYEDERMFAIDKPPGIFVHPPEATGPYRAPDSKIALYTLRSHYRREVFPIHRLDAPTSGIVLFAFNRQTTRELSRLFKDREVEKTYVAVARGHLDDEGRIELPLESRLGVLPSLTVYRTLARVELPNAIGTRYPTARYSYLEIRPHTGRWHQIRRHFDRVAHPLIGDVEHGDSHHNRFFRDELKIPGLCLRATELSFTVPWSGERLTLKAPEEARWSAIQKIFSRIDQ